MTMANRRNLKRRHTNKGYESVDALQTQWNTTLPRVRKQQRYEVAIHRHSPRNWSYHQICVPSWSADAFTSRWCHLAFAVRAGTVFWRFFFFAHASEDICMQRYIQLNSIVGTRRSRKHGRSHIDASHSRRRLIKGKRLVRYEVNAVMVQVAVDSRFGTTHMGETLLPRISP